MKLKGNDLFQAGKFDEAIKCYSEAITILWVVNMCCGDNFPKILLNSNPQSFLKSFNIKVMG